VIHSAVLDFELLYFWLLFLVSACKKYDITNYEMFIYNLLFAKLIIQSFNEELWK